MGKIKYCLFRVGIRKKLVGTNLSDLSLYLQLREIIVMQLGLLSSPCMVVIGGLLGLMWQTQQLNPARSKEKQPILFTIT